MSIKYQKKWDYLLIRAWVKDYKIAWAFNNFFDFVDQEGLSLDNINKCEEWLNANGIKRWATVKESDGCYKLTLKNTAKGFIGMHSIKMSGDLFGHPSNSIDVLLNIENYRWVTPSRNKYSKGRKDRIASVKDDRFCITKKGAEFSGWKTVS